MVRAGARVVNLWILLHIVASLEQRCQLRQESDSDDPSISDALALACETTLLHAMPSASTSRRRTHQYKPRLVVGGHRCENPHSMPILQDATVATPKHVTSPSCQSLRRVAESLERCEVQRALTRQIDSDQTSLQWAAKYNLLWRRRTVVLLERTAITIKHCLLFVWEEAPRQAFLWPILYRTIGHMVACELTGDSGGIGKPTHVKLVRPQARLQCL